MLSLIVLDIYTTSMSLAKTRRPHEQNPFGLFSLYTLVWGKLQYLRPPGYNLILFLTKQLGAVNYGESIVFVENKIKLLGEVAEPDGKLIFGLFKRRFESLRLEFV